MRPSSPSDLLSSTLEDGTTVRRDELSRAFSALNDKGLVHVVSGDRGRKKFFALTPAGKDAMKGLVSLLRVVGRGTNRCLRQHAETRGTGALWRKHGAVRASFRRLDRPGSGCTVAARSLDDWRLWGATARVRVVGMARFADAAA